MGVIVLHLQTHRVRALFNVLGIRVMGHICEQCGAIQWPNVPATGNLHNANNYDYLSPSLSVCLSLSTYLHQSSEIALRYMQSRQPHDQRFTREGPILVLHGAILNLGARRLISD